MSINYYRLHGGNGWERKMWSYPQDAIQEWKSAGKGARLYLVEPDGSERCIRPEPSYDTACYDDTPDIPVILDERKEEYYYVRPLRSRWAVPSF